MALGLGKEEKQVRIKHVARNCSQNNTETNEIHEYRGRTLSSFRHQPKFSNTLNLPSCPTNKSTSGAVQLWRPNKDKYSFHYLTPNFVLFHWRMHVSVFIRSNIILKIKLSIQYLNMNVQGLVAIRHLTLAPTAFIEVTLQTTIGRQMILCARSMRNAHAISKCPRALFICYCF